MVEGGEEDERVELQMSLELGFAAMRLFMKYLRGDFLIDMLVLLFIDLQILDIVDMCREYRLY